MVKTPRGTSPSEIIESKGGLNIKEAFLKILSGQGICKTCTTAGLSQKTSIFLSFQQYTHTLSATIIFNIS